MPSRVLCLGGGAGGPAARRVRLLLRQVVGGGAAAARYGRSEVRALHSSGNPPRPSGVSAPAASPGCPCSGHSPRLSPSRGEAGSLVPPCGLRACPGCAAAPLSRAREGGGSGGGRRSWRKVWSAGTMRSVWRRWGCLTWRKGGSGQTFSLHNSLKGGRNEVGVGLLPGNN